MKRSAANLLLLTISSVAMLLCAEMGFRVYTGYTAKAALPTKVAYAQELLRPEPDIGYLYKPNLNQRVPDSLKWVSQTSEDLKLPIQHIWTDQNGFLNHKDALAYQAKAAVDVIGVGDSFMHDAAYIFFDLFKKHNLSYYNLAMHRHCPPQYNRILKRHAVTQKFSYVLYGVFENDFSETVDFNRWQQSNVDWFRYHSGWWGGPPASEFVVKSPIWRALVKESAIAQRLYKRVIWPRIYAAQAAEQSTLEEIKDNIEDAAALVSSHGGVMIVLLIPSKSFILQGVLYRPYVSDYYDRLHETLTQNGINVIDLREPFLRHANRQQLYWNSDGHWSTKGMELAGEEILRKLDTLSANSRR